ncbi:hypothetical protein FQR65_LT20723 [Abscondita terminalis]|nr:hypothetical protein FQR65_LT20723 [Abscondita terminalis]
MAKSPYEPNSHWRKKCSQQHCAYDGAITKLLHLRWAQINSTLHAVLTVDPESAFRKVQEMRYGENRSKSGAFYWESKFRKWRAGQLNATARQELSYKIADADAAWECVKTFDESACVHHQARESCGVAVASAAGSVNSKALQTDRDSAFRRHHRLQPRARWQCGRSVAKTIRRSADRKTSFSETANRFSLAKQNVRCWKSSSAMRQCSMNLQTRRRWVAGAIGRMRRMVLLSEVKSVREMNAIVFCANGMTMGWRSQMSVIDSARIASIKAQNAGLSLVGTGGVDAFFPFRDGLDVVVAAGATSVIHPGGSMRDKRK